METTTSLTKEQIHIRTGQFTGSEVYKLMGAKGLGKIGETYIFEKIAEHLTGLPCKEDFSSAATTWGNDHEDEARQYFEAATRHKLLTCEQAYGKQSLSNDFMTGTPDRIIARKPKLDTGFEIKCPFNSGNHVKNLSMNTAEDLLDLRPEYYWQCVSYMWLTGLKRWKFCSYDPRFKGEKRMLILNIELNIAHLELLKARVMEAKEMFNILISKI